MNEINLDLKACRLCLETNCRLYDINASTIAYILDEFTSSTASAMKGVPPYVCGLCCAQLLKASTFRSRCMAIQNYLHELSLIEPLTMDIIQNTDRSKMKIQLKTTDILIMYCGDDAEDDKQDVPKSENENDSNDFHDDFECNGNDNSFHPFGNDNLQSINPSDLVKLDKNMKPENGNDGNDFHDDIECNDNNNSFHPFGNDNHQTINPSDFVKVDKNMKPESSNLDVMSKLVEKEKDTTKKKKEDQISKDELKEALQQLISDTKDEHKIALYSFILEKYVLEMKTVNLMDPFDLDDEVLEKNVPNDKDLENMDPNERIFYEFVNEKYKKGMFKKKKVVNVLRQKCKVPVCKQTNETIQEEQHNFPGLANFEVMLLSKKEQRAELLERKVKHTKSPYMCEVCYRGFSMERTYRTHLLVHDPRSGGHVCEICKSRFPTRTKLKRHCLTHKWKFTCKTCGATKKTSAEARIHNTVHEGKTFVCEHCGKTFVRYKSRVEHTRIHHGATRCDICYKGLSNHHAVNLHKSKAHRQVFICDVCNVTFDKKSALNTHLGSLDTSCVDVRPCSACGENLKTEAELENHIMSVHPYRRRPLTPSKVQCCPCGHKEAAVGDASDDNITADSNPDIKVAANTANISHDCNCPCKLVVKRRRKRRIRAELERDRSSKRNVSEEDEKYEHPPKKHKFMCEFCSKDKFQSLIHLQMHQLVHTGEKPHVCPVCSKRFRVKSGLKNHMTVHTGERLYECEFCDKVFKSAPSRHRHQKFIHTGLRPHKCVICDKRFQTASCVKLHVQTVHNKIPYVRKNKRIYKKK